jgi:hypothetical protein
MTALNKLQIPTTPSPDGACKIMNTLTAPKLLWRIVCLRTIVGDGLNDEELTGLLRQEALLPEDGFTFVSLSEGCATFNVPPQEPAKWYRENGLITPEKETIAEVVAEKCGLSLYEPPDESLPSQSPEFGSSRMFHHLALTDDSETIVVAHPHYLKIRLFGFVDKRPLRLRRNILEQLAALYPE